MRTNRPLVVALPMARLFAVACETGWAQDCSTPLPSDLAVPARGMGEDGLFVGV